MIATTRGLLVLAVVALLLGVAIIAIGPRHPATADHALVPRFDSADISELVIARPGEPIAIDLVLRPPARNGSAAPNAAAPRTWRWHAPDGEADARSITMHDEIPVDTTTIDNLLAALRAARWHRSAAVSAAGTIRATLRVVSSGKTTDTIGIGADLPGSEQTWITRAGRAFLVDSWVAHALAPSRLELRIRHPLAATPIANQRNGVWIDPSITQHVRDAFDNVEYLSLDAAQISASFGPIIGDAREIGVCSGGDRVFLLAPVGNGCVDRAAWKAALDAVADLDKPATQIADRRPIPFTPSTIVLPDGVTLDLEGRPRLVDARSPHPVPTNAAPTSAAGPATAASPTSNAGPATAASPTSVDADPERTRELVASLSAAGELIARPAGAPLATLVARDRSGASVTLELYRDAVARQGEQVAIRSVQLAIIAQSSAAYRDSTRWREDPMTVTSIAIDEVTFTRGAVLGEWMRSTTTPKAVGSGATANPAGSAATANPAGSGATANPRAANATPISASDAALVDALASAIATVRAPSIAAAPARVLHQVRVVITPPTGDASTHKLDVGPADPKGCAARVDGAPAQIPLDLCTAVLALHP